MPCVPPCPSAEALRRLLLGETSDAEGADLERHVLACPACLRTLKGLRAEDTLIEAIQARKGEDEPTVGGPVADLMRRLQGLSPATVLTFGPGPVASPPTFDFLAPPEGPDELGRLGGYRVRKHLGTGGMGVVFQAEDDRLQRPVALKVLRPELARDPDSRQRFLREARAAAAVVNDHVVPVYEVGEDRGVPFLAMQLLKGLSLEERLRRPGPLTVPQVLRLGRQIALGLRAAHERGLIHRDIKPANLWVEPEHGGRVKVLDFGLARPVDPEEGLTSHGAIVGTPAYMSPEQARGEAVDARGDLFSLGCVLYRLATGQVPFRGRSNLAVLSAVTSHHPRPPRELNPAVPPSLSDLVMRLLAKAPADRPASARAVAEALQAVERSLARGASPGTTAGGRRWLARAAAAAALVAVLGALGYWLGPDAVRFATNRGEVVIVTDAADVELAVKDARGEVIERKTGRRFSLAAGEHDLEVTLKDEAGAPRFVTSKFTLARGGRQIIDAPLEAASARPPGRGPLDLFRRQDIPDDELAAAGGGDKNKAPAELVAVLGNSQLKHGGTVHAVAFSPDGKLSASAGNDRGAYLVRVWDAATGQAVYTFSGHAAPVYAVTFSPDSRLLASGDLNGHVNVWDVATGQKPRITLRALPQNGPRCLAFSPDGTRLAAALRDGKVMVWEVGARAEVVALKGHAHRGWGVAFSPDGTRLASAGGGDAEVKVWNLKTGQEVRSFPAQSRDVHGAAFSPDGTRFASAAANQKVKLWDVEAGKELRTFDELRADVRCLAFSPDGARLAFAAQDGRVWVSDTRGGEPAVLPPGHNGPVQALAFSPDGRRLASGGEDHTVRLWDVQGREEIGRPPGHAGVVSGLAVSPDGLRLATAGADKTVRVWDLATGKEVAALRGHTRPVQDVAFDRDGRRLASSSLDGSVRVWDVPAARERSRFESPRGTVRRIAFSPDGKWVAGAASDNTVRLWDAETGKPRPDLQGHTSPVNAVAFSRDGKRLASVGPDKNVLVWDAETGKVLLAQNGPDSYVGVAFSRDGKWLATAGKDANVVGKVKVWDALSGREPVPFKEERVSNVTQVAFSPNGDTLAAASETGQVIRWDFPSGSNRRAWSLSVPVLDLVFAPDGRHLLTANGNGTVYVLRLRPPGDS